jgi:signal transduction histidine kinase
MIDTPPLGAAGVGPASATRTRDRDWHVVAPSVFLVLVLAALVLLPFVNASNVQLAHKYTRGFAEPARAAVTDIHVALALEGSLLGDFAESRDSTVLRRYREAARQEEAGTRKLAPLVPRLGAAVRARFAEMERTQEAWHRLIERGLASPGPRGARAHLEGDAYEDVAAGRGAAGPGDRRRGGAHAERDHRRGAHAPARGRRAGPARPRRAPAWWSGSRAGLHVYAVAIEQRGEQLREAVEGRERLMRGISHDIRTRCTPSTGHAQLLQDDILGPLSAGQRDSVARMRRGVRSVLTLVGDLLELSRAEAGRAAHHAARGRPRAAAARGSSRSTRARPTPPGHRLAAECAGVDGAVLTDAERVRQVLGNLLSNAVKYTPRGGAITVRLARRERPDAPRRGEWMVIDVLDTGTGVPEQMIASIFEEFSRLPMHAEQPGVGLGLAIARRIAGLLGGDLTVQNARSGSGRVLHAVAARDPGGVSDPPAGAAPRRRWAAAPVPGPRARRRCDTDGRGPAQGSGGRPAAVTLAPSVHHA